MRKAYQTIRDRFPDKQILCTELSGWGKNRHGWDTDVTWGMANNWLGGPQNWAEVCLQWNLALDDKFGPTPRPDSAAIGLVTIKTSTCEEVKFECGFYAMAQMSRAASPGARHIDASIRAGNGEAIDIIAFSLPKAQTSLVVFNKQDGETPVQVEDRGSFFAYCIPGHSIVTFLW